MSFFVPCPFHFASGNGCQLDRAHAKAGIAHRYELGPTVQQTRNTITITAYVLEVESVPAPRQKRRRRT